MGIRISEDLPRTRGADVAYLSFKRLPKGKLPEHFFSVAPELVVEIFPVNGSWDKMSEKVDDYITIGVELVWVARDYTHRENFYAQRRA